MSYGATGPPASLASASPTPPDTREIAPLLPSDKDRWTRHRLGGRAMVVSNLILTLATSMLDVVCYAKYSTFSSNQTGNTVMLATASLHLRTSPRKCILATTSLVAWLTGAFLFGQARRSRELAPSGERRAASRRRWHNSGALGALGALASSLLASPAGTRSPRPALTTGRNSRGWLFVTSGAQMAVLLLYVWLISPYAPSVFDLDGRYEWVSMATCAFQSGIQFVMATGVGVREINAATVTASYASLVADPLLFSTTPQQGRDRRVVYLVTFWLGCILGLFFEQHLGAWAAALIVAGVKLLSFAIIYHAEEAE